MLFSFGSGVLIGQRTDITGTSPVNFGRAQDISIETKFSTKKANGQFQFPLDIARGTGTVTGKMKSITVSALAMASLVFGATLVAGQTATQFQEAAVVPAASAYTVQTANHTTWTQDLGVTYVATGLPLTQVAPGSEALGKYSVAAGVYTFAAADASAAILISYTYTIAGSGGTLTLTNQLLGFTPTFSCNFYTVKNGKQITVQLTNCVSNSFSFATKLEDYTMPEIDFEAFADAANRIMTWNVAEVS